jgi:hypothetical protein
MGPKRNQLQAVDSRLRIGRLVRSNLQEAWVSEILKISTLLFWLAEHGGYSWIQSHSVREFWRPSTTLRRTCLRLCVGLTRLRFVGLWLKEEMRCSKAWCAWLEHVKIPLRGIRTGSPGIICFGLAIACKKPNPPMRVSDFISTDSMSWNKHVLQEWFLPLDIENICKIPLSTDTSPTYL